MVSNKTKIDHENEYDECLRELGEAIGQFRKDSRCSIKPLMGTVHSSHRTIKGVCLANA